MIDTILCFDNQRNKKVEISQKLFDFLSAEKFQKLNHKELREKYKIHLLGDVEETDEKECLFSLSKKDEKYSLSTSNLMGVVNLSDGNETVRLVIGSRFDKKPKTDENVQIEKDKEGKDVYEPDPEQPFFLHMLEKVYRCDFAMDAEGSSHTLWDILLAIRFRVLLEQAANIGVLRLYQTIHHNDLRFRGRLDINRHILRNSLIKDKIAYDTHERTADNPINHLILHAEKYVRRKFPDLLPASQNAEDLLKQIKTEVPSLGSKSVQSVIGDKDNVKTLRHPYYAEYYEELRRVSLALLREGGSNVFDDKEEDALNGIIISGAWLWEEYVFALMKEANSGFIHANPAKKEHPVHRYDGGRCIYPDFRLPVKKGEEQMASVVFDAKYKFNGSVRDDLNQVMTYMYLTGADVGGFIYPPQDDEDKKRIEKAKAEQRNDDETDDQEFESIFENKIIFQCTSEKKKSLWSYTFKKNGSDENAFNEMEKGFAKFLKDVNTFHEHQNP